MVHCSFLLTELILQTLPLHQAALTSNSKLPARANPPTPNHHSPPVRLMGSHAERSLTFGSKEGDSSSGFPMAQPTQLMVPPSEAAGSLPNGLAPAQPQAQGASHQVIRPQARTAGGARNERLPLSSPSEDSEIKLSESTPTLRPLGELKLGSGPHRQHHRAVSPSCDKRIPSETGSYAIPVFLAAQCL